MPVSTASATFRPGSLRQQYQGWGRLYLLSGSPADSAGPCLSSLTPNTTLVPSDRGWQGLKLRNSPSPRMALQTVVFPEGFLGQKQCEFFCTFSTKSQMKLVLLAPHFMDAETEARKGEVTCSRCSAGKWECWHPASGWSDLSGGLCTTGGVSLPQKLLLIGGVCSPSSIYSICPWKSSTGTFRLRWQIHIH